MKAGHIVLLGGFFLIVLNTLSGLIMGSYEISSCLFADLSILMSTILLYYLFMSRISDGFKISMAIVLAVTGVIRLIFMAIMGSEIHNNLFLLLAALILLIEITILFVVSYLSKK